MRPEGCATDLTAACAGLLGPVVARWLGGAGSPRVTQVRRQVGERARAGVRRVDQPNPPE